MKQKYLKELSQWFNGTEYDYNSNLEYSFRNGYFEHALSLWINSGASTLDIPIKINRKKEELEIKKILKNAVIVECQYCNHTHFFDELNHGYKKCESCLTSFEHLTKP